MGQGNVLGVEFSRYLTRVVLARSISLHLQAMPDAPRPPPTTKGMTDRGRQVSYRNQVLTGATRLGDIDPDLTVSQLVRLFTNAQALSLVMAASCSQAGPQGRPARCGLEGSVETRRR